MDKVYALIIYDIVNDKRRIKFATKMNQYGIRVQKSAFEVYIPQYKFKHMVLDAEKLIDKKEDSLRIYRFNKPCEMIFSGKNLQIFRDKCIVI